MEKFAHPEVLVSTDWVNEHRNDPAIKLIEIDILIACNKGHKGIIYVLMDNVGKDDMEIIRRTFLHRGFSITTRQGLLGDVLIWDLRISWDESSKPKLLSR